MFFTNLFCRLRPYFAMRFSSQNSTGSRNRYIKGSSIRIACARYEKQLGPNGIKSQRWRKQGYKKNYVRGSKEANNEKNTSKKG